MVAAAFKPLTYAEYLQLELDTGIKHEWKSGYAVAMAGGTLSHAQLITRLSGLLFGRLKGKPCQPWGSEAKVRIPAEDVSTYPDLSVVCGEPIPDAVDRNSLTNPTVLFEVLSESTANYDREEKFDYYKSLPTLRDYVLVSQRFVSVMHHERRANGTWLAYPLSAGDTLRLKSIRVRVPMDEIYAGVPLESRKPRLSPP